MTLLNARVIRFCTVGLSGVIVDNLVLYVLHDPARLGWDLVLSKAIAAELAMINNFLWNDLWTFGDIARQQRGWTTRLKRLLTFNFFGLVGLGLNVLLVHLLVNTVHLQYLLANLTAIATVTFWNFGMNQAFNWRQARVRKNG